MVGSWLGWSGPGSGAAAVADQSTALKTRCGRPGSNRIGSGVEAGFLHSDFDFQAEHRSVCTLMHRYRERPMTFADACIVRMAELRPDAVVWTLDRDFQFYRKHGRQTLSLVAPW